MTTVAMNHSLFVEQPTEYVGDHSESLLGIWESWQDGLLQVPNFQRAYCWDRNQLIDWIASIIDQDSIGVIVTYQINGEGIMYLADGFQRLTATDRFLRQPESYGFKIGLEQAKLYVKSMKITRQHRHWKSHRAAMLKFQKLNQGTALTPAEYYKGLLTVDNPLGTYIFEHIPGIVRAATVRLITNRQQDRRVSSTSTRDNYALLLQYISEDKRKTFWRIGGSKVDRVYKGVEQSLAEYMETRCYTDEMLHEKLDGFERFINSQICELEQAMEQTGQRGKFCSDTFVRWFLHLSIWRKNTGVPVGKFKEFMAAMLNLYKTQPSISSRVEVRDSKDNGLIKSVSLQKQSISSVQVFYRATGIDLEASIRKSSGRAALGYDVSHITPVSVSGEGPTIFEPSSTNRARGAKPIGEDE